MLCDENSYRSGAYLLSEDQSISLVWSRDLNLGGTLQALSHVPSRYVVHKSCIGILLMLCGPRLVTLTGALTGDCVAEENVLQC